LRIGRELTGDDLGIKLGPLSALAISTTFLSKMARTNEEQQPKANSYHW
jgi:hypothetical protein